MNRDKPHVLIFPEDNANCQLANGFLEHLDVDNNAIKILSPAVGWKNVGDKFPTHIAPHMEQHPLAIAILLVDGDNKEGEVTNFSYVKQQVPKKLQNRVFIIGVFSEPEELKKKLKLSFEKIGEQLAEDCHKTSETLWQHKLLAHNQAELQRMASEEGITFEENLLTAKQIIFGYGKPR